MEKYPLEQLATIKQKKLEEAERVLQEKKRLLELEEAKLAERQKERDKVKEHKDAKLQQLRDELDAGTTSDKVQQMKYYLKVVDEQLKQKETKLKEQQKVVDAAQSAVETARQDLLKKQQDVEKLKMHRKEWEQEMRREEVRKEQIETDETGASLHTIRKQADKRAKHSSHPKKGKHHD